MIKRNYEVAMIASANLTDEEAQAVFDKFKNIVKDAGFSVKFESSWGRRKLADEIDKQQYGIYLFIYVDADGAVLEELSLQCGYDENMLKLFSVAVDDLEQAYQNFEALKKDPKKNANLVSEMIGA